MLFNTRLFRDQLRAALFRSRGTEARLTGKRIKTLIGMLVFLPPIRLITYLGMALDEIYFPGYRRQPIERPLFIIGNFRTGTTFLQRLMARDDQFSTMQTWEIYTAPSVSQRKLMRGISIVDRFFGGFIHKILGDWEKRSLGQVKMHPVGIHMADEDEGMFLHIWSGVFTWFLFPVQGVPLSFPRFDQIAGKTEKSNLMRFYRGCIKRHLYAHGGQYGVHRRYLAKNPSSSPRVATLRRWFPDAQFVYMARNPLEMVPSKLGWFSFCFRYFSTPRSRYPFRDELLAMMLHWFEYPLRVLDGDANTAITRCEDLTTDVEQTVSAIYRKLGLTMTPDFAELVRAAGIDADAYSPDHDNSLAGCDLTPAYVAQYFATMFRRFGYPTPGSG